MDEISYRRYQDGDEVEIIHLLDTVFDGWPGFDLECSKKDHWRWKFIENHLGKNFITVAVINDKIIGVKEALFLNYWIGSRIYRGWISYDNAIHPDYQGKGIFSKLSDYGSSLPEFMDREFVVASTENPIIQARDIKEGYLKFPKKVNKYVKIRDIGTVVKGLSLNERVKNLLGFHTLKTISSVSRRFTHVNKYKVKTIPIVSFNDDIDPFISKMYSKHDFMFERSMEYLNWRYCDLRGGEYKIFLSYIEDNIAGYIVCRVSSHSSGNLWGYIIDLLVDPDYPQAAYSLLKAGLDYLEKYEVNLVMTWVVEDHWLKKVFSYYGLLDSYQEVGVSLGPQDIGDDKITILDAPSDRLHLQIGDTDWI